MFSLVVRNRNILMFILSVILIFFFMLMCKIEISNAERVILPFCFFIFISSGIYLLLNHFCKDKFCAKIFLISVLLHLIFVLFWQFLKYYLLGLPVPTTYSFHGYVSDVDGGKYHALGVYISQHISSGVLSEKLYGGLFAKIIGFIYYYIAINPFIISCLNAFISGFTAIIIYLIGKNTLKSRETAKIFSVLAILNFAHLMNTSTLIRDAYIVLFMFLSIWSSYLFYKHRNILNILATILSLYALFSFRPYAAFVIFFAIVTAFGCMQFKVYKKNNTVKTNAISLVIILLFPIIIGIILYLLMQISTFMNILSVEDLIATRELAYSGSTTDYAMDFGKLYGIFPLLPFIVGYICLFLAPFPWEWVLVRRMIYVPDMLILYCFLPSFIKNLKHAIFGKQYYLTVFFFSMLFMFTIYSITLGNSGSIHRLRGPYIPMIYLIAMYRPDKFLSRILCKVQKWRIV